MQIDFRAACFAKQALGLHDDGSRQTVLLMFGINGQIIEPSTMSLVTGHHTRYNLAMKADLRISIKDHRRNKNLKIQLVRPYSTSRQFRVRMNGVPWPKDGRPVSIARLLTALRKPLVKSL